MKDNKDVSHWAGDKKCVCSRVVLYATVLLCQTTTRHPHIKTPHWDSKCYHMEQLWSCFTDSSVTTWIWSSHSSSLTQKLDFSEVCNTPGCCKPHRHRRETFRLRRDPYRRGALAAETQIGPLSVSVLEQSVSWHWQGEPDVSLADIYTQGKVEQLFRRTDR